MSFCGFILTNQGRRELAKAELGGPLEFDYVAVGDGERTGSALSTESLSHELHQLPVLSVTRNGDSVIVETELSSENIQNGFYFREIGLYANGILYVYDNAGQDAEYIDAAGAAVARQKRIRIALTVASEACVTVKLDPGLHTAQKDFLSHVMAQGNPHNVTKEDLKIEKVDNTADIDKPVSKLVQKELDAINSSKADKESPEFTGTPKAPTPPQSSNDTRIATTGFVNAQVSGHDASPSAHDDMRRQISGLAARLNALADSDDTTLDQLSEIVAYIKNNKSLIDGVTTSKVSVSDIIDSLTSTATDKPLSAKQGKTLKDLIDALTTTVGNKVDKISGKGLSTNDYTTEEKNKLKGIAFNANNYSLPLAASGTRGGVKTGYAQNGKNYPVQLSNEQMYVNVPWTDTNTTYAAATQTASGLMSAADKKKLDGVSAGANSYSLPLAASGTRGGVKTGYSQNGRNYPVQLSNEQMYVNVPWTDTNTTYGTATQSANGLMSAADKAKLDGVKSGSAKFVSGVVGSGWNGNFQKAGGMCVFHLHFSFAGAATTGTKFADSPFTNASSHMLIFPALLLNNQNVIRGSVMVTLSASGTSMVLASSVAAASGDRLICDGSFLCN